MVQSRAGEGSTVQLALRLPEDLRDRVRAAADLGGRSMNSELVATLEEKYPAPLSDKDIFHRCVIAAHMLRQMVRGGDLSDTRYKASAAPIFYALKKMGYDDGIEALKNADIQEALDAGIGVEELLDWTAEITAEFEEKYSAVLDNKK